MTKPRADGERRRFLKGVVGGAATVSLTTAAVVSVETITANRGSGGGGLTEYRGIRNVTGPAPRALPQVPVTVDEDGYLVGRWPDATSNAPSTTLGGEIYSADWFRYCGFEDHDGFRPESAQAGYLRATADPPYRWQADDFDGGERLHVSDFADYEEWENGIGTGGLGKPAVARWRSEGTDESFPVQVLRSGRVRELRERGDEWLRASTSEDFIAWAAACTYNCATTAFKGYEESETFDAGDLVYCSDHQSLFDPFDVVSARYVVPQWDE